MTRFKPLWPLIAGLAAAPAIAAGGFAPGQWEHQTHLVHASVPGIPEWAVKLAAGHGNRKSCNGSGQQSHPELLLQGDDTAICKLQKLSMTGGKLVFDTFCTNKHFPDGLLVASRGSYTATSYSISTISTGKKDGKQVRIQTTGTGKRVSASCGKS